MKKTLILLLAFLLLGAGVFWFTQEDKGHITTIKAGDRDFAVKNVDQIGKIFIADRSGFKVTLDRKDDHWTFNEKHRARPDAIGNLLQTISGIEMKFIPPKNGIPVIVKTLASHGVKVEIYDLQGEIMKTYYVGGTTNNERATYMIMEDAEQPYAMYHPLVDGNLRLRYRIDGDDWRDRTVFTDKSKDIDFISIEYPKQKNKSFKIQRKGNDNDYIVSPFYENVTPKITRPFVRGLGEKFFNDFNRLIAEGYQNEKKDKEAIMSMVPFAIVTVKNKKGEETSVRFHPTGGVDAKDNVIFNPETGSKSDIGRYNVYRSNGDFLLVQQRVFGKIFWQYESFFES